MAKILCVEDEDEIRADLVEELVDAGHEVFAASDGMEGLKAVSEFRPDLILSDCLMPKMTGPELLRALRQDLPEFAETPFLFLSAHADESHVEEGLGLGADGYLKKPVDFDHLIEKVESLLVARRAGATKIP